MKEKLRKDLSYQWMQQAKNAKSTSEKTFPTRYIYFGLDGQDVLNLEDLKFAYLEINEKLCKIVSSKT